MTTISKREYQEAFERERVRISHDLFKNRYGATLQPGWGEPALRGTDEDLLVRALRNEGNCAETLAGILAIWSTEVFPPLDRLLCEVSARYGLVPSARFQEEVKGIHEADRAIRSVLAMDTQRTEGARVELFWSGCEVVGGFLGALGRRAWDYFDRWDPTHITTGEDWTR